MKSHLGHNRKSCGIMAMGIGSQRRSQNIKKGRGIKGSPQRVNIWSNRGHVDWQSRALRQQTSRIQMQPREHRYLLGAGGSRDFLGGDKNTYLGERRLSTGSLLQKEKMGSWFTGQGERNQFSSTAEGAQKG